MEKLVENPSTEEVKNILEEYLHRSYTVQINGLCAVNYQGRAKSKLDKGERIVIKKQDSALLVHGPEGYQPKNWQPEVDEFEVNIEEDLIKLVAKRNNPEERVEILFREISFIQVSQLVDKSDLRVKGHEIDIHEAIDEEPEILEEGLSVIERERKTPAGYIDIFARDDGENYVVIEVKRNPDYNSVIQLQRYVDEIDEEFNQSVRGILVAPKITDNILDYLTERDLDFIEIEMKDVIPSYEDFEESQSGLNDF